MRGAAIRTRDATKANATPRGSRFGLVFGSTTRAAGVVLAAFFLGMAGGNWIGGRVAAVSRATALRRYA